MTADAAGGCGVGFGKPPRHTRFQKGQSGNPRGRRKGDRNLAILLGKTLSERVVISENGKRRTITKLEATVKQLVNKAASGDPKLMQQLLALVQLVEGRAEALNPPAAPLTESDRSVIDGIHRRIARRRKETDDA